MGVFSSKITDQGIVQYSTVKYPVKQYSTIEYSKVPCIAVQYPVVQYSTVK